MTTLLTTRTEPSSIHSNLKTAPPDYPSLTKRRPRPLSRRCMSGRNMRAKRHSRPRSHQPGDRGRLLLPMGRLVGLCSVACCIVRAQLQVRRRRQHLRRQYRLLLPRHWPQARLQVRLQVRLLLSQTCHSMQSCWTSSRRWELPKTKLPRTPISSRCTLIRSKRQLNQSLPRNRASLKPPLLRLLLQR
jgi:hypothetical protein